jgi:hypothetical protein
MENHFVRKIRNSEKKHVTGFTQSNDKMNNSSEKIKRRNEVISFIKGCIKILKVLKKLCYKFHKNFNGNFLKFEIQILQFFVFCVSSDEKTNINLELQYFYSSTIKSIEYRNTGYLPLKLLIISVLGVQGNLKELQDLDKNRILKLISQKIVNHNLLIKPKLFL